MNSLQICHHLCRKKPLLLKRLPKLSSFMQEIKQPTTNSIVDDEISLKEVIYKLREWWQYLLSKWVTIVIAGLIGSALGLGYAFFQKPVYTAQVTFALEEDKGGGGLGAYAGLASQFGIDMGGG